MADNHDGILQDWTANAARNEAANFRFLQSLKVVSDRRSIDTLASELHAEAFGQIDCTRCANCCKTIPPSFTDEEIGEIAGHLGMSREQFVETYLVVHPVAGDYRMKVTPCPFLAKDDRCTIYDIRPEACRGFPHTNKAQFASRVYLHSSNIERCPAVYYIVKKMRDRLRSR